MNKQNAKLISIIVPCFNSGKTIKRTIESLKSQTWEEKEIIIVNDGSDDQETLDILNLFEGILIINQKNLGLSAARNTGAYKQKEGFFSFLIQMIGLKMML